MGKECLWTRDYILVVVMSAFQNLQNQLVNPIMARFGRDMGIDMGIIGVLVGVFSIASLVMRPVGGVLSDKVNNKAVAAIGAATMGLATLGYIISGGNVGLILCFRLLHGMAFGLCGTTLMRMASLLIPPSRMGEGMGLFGLGQVLSVAVAPGIGLFLANNFGYSATFVAGAFIVGGVAVLCLFLRLPEQEKIMQQTKQYRKKSWIRRIVAPEAVPLALMACALFFANSIESNFVILYGEDLGLSGLGIYFSLGAAIMLLVRFVSGKMQDKKGLRAVLVPAILCVSAAMLMLAAAGILPLSVSGIYGLFLGGSVVKALGHATAQPAIQTACVQSVEPQRRGVASGTFYMGSDIGMGLAPMVGGAVAGGLGFPALYGLAAVVAALGLIGMRWVKKE